MQPFKHLHIILCLHKHVQYVCNSKYSGGLFVVKYELKFDPQLCIIIYWDNNTSCSVDTVDTVLGQWQHKARD